MLRHSRRLFLSLPHASYFIGNSRSSRSSRNFSSRVAASLAKTPATEKERRVHQNRRKSHGQSLCNLLGYSLATVFIPYSVAWFLASNGSARALVHSEQLDDALRHHFGQPEDGSMSYYDGQTRTRSTLSVGWRIVVSANVHKKLLLNH